MMNALKRALMAQASWSPHYGARRVSKQDLEATLRTRFVDWRGMLRRNVQEARPVLESLLSGRITVTPRDQGLEFNVRIPLTTRAIFEGICGPQGDTSPGVCRCWTWAVGASAGRSVEWR